MMSMLAQGYLFRLKLKQMRVNMFIHYFVGLKIRGFKMFHVKHKDDRLTGKNKTSIEYLSLKLNEIDRHITIMYLTKMFQPKCLSLLFTALLSTASFANVDTVKYKLSQNYPNIKIENLKATEMGGLYSGTLDNQVVYVNEEAQHLFLGSMIRLRDQHNLTKDLVLNQNSIDFKKLPLQDAIKTVKGTGKRQLAIFSDPNCPYCKTLENNLSQLKDVTIYTFMYPIKSQSIIPSRKVWCSPNKEFAWKSLIQNAVQPTASADCQNPIERNLTLGKSLGLQGTPVIIFSNGFKVTGAYPAQEIEKIWKELGL